MKLLTATEIQSAHKRLKKIGVTSEILQANEPGIYLKTENQLMGNSYKIRGVIEFFARLNLRSNVKSNPVGSSIKVLSAGNLALATAIESLKQKIHCQSLVPEGISEAKKSLLKHYGSEIIEMPFEEIWKLVNQSPLSLGHEYLHPLNPSLLCGYSTLIPELQSQLTRYDAIVVPYGLGGLTLALAQGCKVLGYHPRIYAVEIKGHSPFFSFSKAGGLKESPKLRSFIEAMGAPGVLPEVFDQLKNFEIETILVTQDETKEAIRDLVRLHSLQVEGAAGAAYAAARKLSSIPGEGQQIVAILTGGNISQNVLSEILAGSS